MPFSIFEQDTSPLHVSNDGRLLIIGRERQGEILSVVDGKADSEVLISTKAQVIADAFVAGYDYAQRVAQERHEALLANPPEHLADAWKRYQEGGDVSGYELAQLDEWRADVNEEA